jgi:hypothetical protein
MRTVRVSKTALDQLNALLAQGIEPFGVRVVAEKRDRVYATIEHVLAAFPAVKRPHPTWDFASIRSPERRSSCSMISTIPKLRVHFIFLSHGDLRDLDTGISQVVVSVHAH